MKLTQTILIIFAVFAVCSLLGVLLFNFLKRKKKFVLAGINQNSTDSPDLKEDEISVGKATPAIVIIKILALFGLIIWTFALLATRNSPALAYEANIYTATPLIFWIANTLNLILGIGIMIHQITYQRHKQGPNLWIIGFILVFFTLASIVAVWIIRGYAFLGGADALTHLGTVNNLINTGHVLNTNYYPITHIFLAQLSEITNLSSSIIHNYTPYIFTLLSLLFMYCMAKTVLPRKQQALIALLVWMTFLAGYWVQLAPNQLANFYFPLVIFVLLKCLYSKLIQWKIMFVIMIFLLPMFHPLVTFVLAAFILAMWLYDRIINDKKSKIERSSSHFIFASFVISLVWSVLWVSPFMIWRNLMVNVLANLTTRGTSNLNSLIGQISYASQYHYSIILMFFKTFTPYIIIGLIAAFSLIVLWRRGIFKRKTDRLVLLFAPLAMLVVVILFFYIENTQFSPTRIIIFFILFCTLYVGYILYDLIRKNNILNYHHIKSGLKIQKFSALIISVLLIFLFIVSFVQYYPSRYVLDWNYQITRTEYSGMNWFLQSKDSNVPDTTFTVDTARWATLFLTSDEQIKSGYLYPGQNKPAYLQIPWHFGYDTKQNLGQFFDNDTYMLLSGRDRVIYQDIWPEMASIRLQPQDFNKIEEDNSINKLYSNDGLDVYYVNTVNNGVFEIDPFNWAK